MTTANLAHLVPTPGVFLTSALSYCTFFFIQIYSVTKAYCFSFLMSLVSFPFYFIAVILIKPVSLRLPQHSCKWNFIFTNFPSLSNPRMYHQFNV